MLSCNKIYNYNKLNKDKEKVNQFFIKDILKKNQKVTSSSNYYLVIEIPKIALKKGIYNINSIHNNINENIAILKEDSDDIVLAAHSGNSNTSYFKDLYKLSLGDYIYLYSNDTKFIYKVVNYYEEDKDGDIIILDNTNNKRLVLTTCIGINRQLVYITYLKQKLSY